ncbi:MAG: hypothetical protein HQ582_19040 [Planctomycetes bacterium]|nr:hypothetical protein [Planctomycetota bacterium]
MAAFLLILCAMHVIQLASTPRIALTPLVFQLLLAVLLTVALARHCDELSYHHYKRYIGGNFALFAGAFLLCRGERKIRLAWRVWMVAAILMSLLGIWYWLNGINWASGRARLVPGTGVRMGYQCGVALIYLLFSKDRLLPFVRFPLAAVLLFAVFTSGSKMAVLLAAGVVLLFAVRNLTSTRQTGLGQFLLLILMGISGLSIAMILLRGDDFAYYRDTFELNSYRGSYAARTELGMGYLRYAMDTPWGGKGISAAYDQIGGFRTHSVSQALLVQAGVPGALLYVLFAGWIAVNGLRMLLSRSSLSSGRDLLLATYIAALFLFVRAEITGDVPGNRELWLFSGLLLSCFILRTSSIRSDVGIRRPSPLVCRPQLNSTHRLSARTRHLATSGRSSQSRAPMPEPLAEDGRTRNRVSR